MRLSRSIPLAVGLALLAACTPKPGTTAFRDPGVPASSLTLVAFTSCDSLLHSLRSAAKSTVGPYGFGPAVAYATADAARQNGAPGAEAKAPNAGAPNPAAPDAAGPGAARPAGPDGGSEPSYSGTNTHEPGVDEPDLVKTDGRRIVTVHNGVLQVVDASTRLVTGRVQVLDRAFGGAVDLLLAGDQALVLQRYGDVEPAYGGPAVDDRAPSLPGAPDRPQPTSGPAGPRLVLVSLVGTPRVSGQYRVDGSLVDARQVGATVRVVVSSAPRIPFAFDAAAGRTDADRIAANRGVIDRAPLEAWLPRFESDDATGHHTGRVDCGAVSRPARYGGDSLLTVLTFDLARTALGTGAPVSIVADGQTVYSNGSSLYVANDASSLRLGVGGRTDTEVYKFDTAGTDAPRFLAAGSVPGYLINQYALSEWNGDLRVATSTVQPWRSPDGRTDTSVYVLRHRGRQLAEVGHVSGLGAKGEHIYAVRFLGPVGYLVTFRQTDPLYTLDLRDPARPRVVGELKLTGYSAYLHPAGDGRLIGVGQEASEQGRVQGTQVSLFDVHDPAAPTRLSRYAVRAGHSEAEFDPHAFLYWPAARLLVIPVTTPGVPVSKDGSGGAVPPVAPGTPVPPDAPVAGTAMVPYGGDASRAIVLLVGDAGFTELGTISHPAAGGYPAGAAPIRRSLVVNDTLWTVSEAGLAAHDIRTLERRAWIPYP